MRNKKRDNMKTNKKKKQAIKTAEILFCIKIKRNRRSQ